MRPQPLPASHPSHLLGSAALWLLCGSALVLTTVVPMHTALLGWTPAFWLIGAPMIVLLALKPTLPHRLLLSARPPRHALDRVVWH
ncbi:MAG: hypothetical protein ACREPQ_19750 [Rhodanobacter sp.]